MKNITLLIALLAFTSTGSAANLTWTLENMMSGANSVTGSFAYDAATQVYSSVNLFSSLGGAYTNFIGIIGGAFEVQNSAGNGTLFLYSQPALPPPGAGGTVSALAFEQYVAATATYGANGGALTTAPEPSSLYSGAAGLAALLAIASTRRRTWNT